MNKVKPTLEFAPVELTREQEKKWSDTMSLMAWTAPGFRHLFYRLLANNNGKYTALMTPDCPGGVACTDGRNIIANPDTFFNYSLKERVFIMGHEVVHNVYDDPNLLWRLRNETHITTSDGKTFPYTSDIMQKAMDYRINAMLVESRIGAMPKDALYDPKIAEGKDGVFDIYGKVYKQDKSNGGTGPNPNAPGQGNPQGQNGFDPGGVQPPGQSTGQQPGQAAQQRNSQQWAMEVASARHMEELRSQGKMPGSMKHMFDEILEPKVFWTDYIETMCKRIMGSGSYNWKKPDRRFIGRDLWLPGKGGEGAGWLVIWGDTSGSISTGELNRYMGEMRGMIEDVKPRRLTVVWCDAQIHHIDEVTDTADLEHIKARGVGGRGGTAIEPVWDWIAENRDGPPDMFIGMTDGEFSFPAQPEYPIVWASVAGTTREFPYGDVVPINT
jgi:predicted metal-dependent peptidase